ncbi:hypothetical protein BpHYR1_022275 [Brachionus plicatilis]|uniref:Uncharacterized protein n=1 Tax=Brachionus plicatilis TaxID=10195 RepID=A0A3M7REG7_BRAPC|nr:hypothetical protein BpHYR1_022275 [Brachionus plicatilis]
MNIMTRKFLKKIMYNGRSRKFLPNSSNNFTNFTATEFAYTMDSEFPTKCQSYINHLKKVIDIGIGKNGEWSNH